MSARVIGKRYAKALIQIAQDMDNVFVFESDLSEFRDVLANNKDLAISLKNPKISKEIKLNTVEEILTKVSSQPMVKNIVKLLVKKNRIHIFNEIVEIYISLARELTNQTIAEVIVAKALNKSKKQALIKELSAYTGKVVSLVEIQDPNILGGAITSIDSFVLDGSIKNRLNMIRENMIKASY